jgi:hydrogenase/urease accessory protein HupE
VSSTRGVAARHVRTAAGLAAATAAFLLLSAPRVASAHLGNISYATFAVRGPDVLLELKYAAHITPGLPKDQQLVIRAQVLALEGGIEKWLRETTRLESEGRECGMELDNIVGPDANQDLTVTAVWSCDVKEIRGLRVVFQPLAALLDDWQTIASMKLGGQSYSTVFTPDATHWRIGDVEASAPPLLPQGDAKGLAGQTGNTGNADDAAGALSSRSDAVGSEGATSFGRFFALGVHHIWTGYDHLLFLLAVLLAGGGLRRLAAIVTSFTIAHSITLGAAATGLVRLPVAPVEAAIAISIVVVAVENMLGRGADRRALVTFFFGLIHGFGFASVLAETALPAGEVVVPLLAFNLGVEAGQLAVVVVVVPVLGVALRSGHGGRLRLVLSALIAIAGAVWAFERIGAILR